MHIDVCAYILKYSLLDLYNVTFMYVFRSGHLVLDKQSVCSSHGKTSSPALSVPWFPEVLWVVLKLPGLHHITLHVNTSVISLLFCLNSHGGETLWV